MKVYTKMPDALKPFYQNELTKAAASFKKGHYIISWRHLERAHVLGQPYPYQHTAVHFKMFLFGIKLKNWKEVNRANSTTTGGWCKIFCRYNSGW